MANLNNLHIIIAEDDEDDRAVMEDFFRRNGAFSQVDTVKNGQELVDFLNLNTTNLPDVILTDINMPIMDGLSALEQLYKKKLIQEIPTFVYSTSVNSSYQERCIALGVRDYLVKPFTLDGFNDIVFSILGKIQ